MEDLCLYFKSPLAQLWVDGHIVKYEIRSLHHLLEVIIPHFDIYPLRLYKRYDFLKMREIVTMKAEKRHLERDGMRKRLSLAYAMNLDPAAISRRKRPIEDCVPSRTGYPF